MSICLLHYKQYFLHSAKNWLIKGILFNSFMFHTARKFYNVQQNLSLFNFPNLCVWLSSWDTRATNSSKATHTVDAHTAEVSAAGMWLIQNEYNICICSCYRSKLFLGKPFLNWFYCFWTLPKHPARRIQSFHHLMMMEVQVSVTQFTNYLQQMSSQVLFCLFFFFARFIAVVFYVC